MIYYNIQALESKLKASELPKRHSFIYAILLIIIASLGAFRLGGAETTELWVNNVDFLLNTIIFLGFSIYLYRLCRDSGHEDAFFDYYFSICFVMLVRFFVYSFLIAIPLLIVKEIVLPGGYDDLGDIADLSLNALIGLIYYYFVIRSFNRVLWSK